MIYLKLPDGKEYLVQKVSVGLMKMFYDYASSSWIVEFIKKYLFV